MPSLHRRGTPAREIPESIQHQTLIMSSTQPESDLPIILRDSADPEIYETARVGRVFNQRRPNRYPVAIVEAKSEAHILAAVGLAKERGWRVSVRSGGHSW